MSTYIKSHSYAILFVILSLGLGIFILFSMEDHSATYEKVVVSKGQSLWKIASIYEGNYSMTHQEFVKWVQEHNQMNDDVLKAGDTITIPVKVKKSYENSENLALKTE